jgi:hypothetical protein
MHQRNSDAEELPDVFLDSEPVVVALRVPPFQLDDELHTFRETVAPTPNRSRM